MAVAANANVYFVPIFRPAELLKSPLIGRWHGRVGAVGDGTGGNILLTLGLDQLPNVFGPHSLISVEFLNPQITCTVSPTLLNLILQFNEPTSGQAYQQYIINLFNLYGGNSIDNQPPFGKMTFRVGQTPGIADAIQMTTNNVATTTFALLSCGGYIYDERFMLMP